MKIDDFQSFLNKKFNNTISVDRLSDLKYQNYINTNCTIHGDYKIRYDHLKDYGCPKCSKVSSTNRSKESFIKRSNIKHNNIYNYDNVKYLTNKIPVEIVCPRHGSFYQRPDNHLAGAGCTYCNYKLSNDDFIQKCKDIHGEKYEYDRVKYSKYKDYVEIKCPKHGYFNQLARVHLSGFGCPICHESIGELNVSKYLESRNIKFIRQYKFDECRNKIKLSFDFYLPDYNTCIEFNGHQHYIPIEHFGGEKRLEIQKATDKIKSEFCLKNKISLIIISYKDDINIILDCNL